MEALSCLAVVYCKRKQQADGGVNACVLCVLWCRIVEQLVGTCCPLLEQLCTERSTALPCFNVLHCVALSCVAAHHCNRHHQAHRQQSPAQGVLPEALKTCYICQNLGLTAQQPAKHADSAPSMHSAAVLWVSGTQCAIAVHSSSVLCMNAMYHGCCSALE
jgi:hypothetical protein